VAAGIERNKNNDPAEAPARTWFVVATGVQQGPGSPPGPSPFWEVCSRQETRHPSSSRPLRADHSSTAMRPPRTSRPPAALPCRRRLRARRRAATNGPFRRGLAVLRTDSRAGARRSAPRLPHRLHPFWSKKTRPNHGLGKSIL